LIWHSEFAKAFWPALAAGVVAGVLLIAITYVVAERWFQLRERKRSRNEVVDSTLRLILNEIEDNRRQAELLIKHAPQDELPYPLFDLNGWVMASQADVFLSLSALTRDLIIKLYNRFRTTNETHAALYDLMFGPTAIQVATQVDVARAASAGDVKREIVASFERFDAYRKERVEGVVDRTQELLEVLDDTVDRIEEELAVRAEHRRRFLVRRHS
jgi:hypothetical protein